MRAQAYMCRKWRNRLPIPTLIVPLTTSRWPVFKINLKLRLRQRRRASRAVDPSTDPQKLASQIGIE